MNNPPVVEYVVECVPNFSEGRNPATIDALVKSIESVPQVAVLHRTSDPDHNRSVITFAGSSEAVLESSVRVAGEAIRRIDLNHQQGVHPRIGAIDVLPFVPLGSTPMEVCIDLAHRAGRRIESEWGLPVYFYESAALRPSRIRLEEIRRGQFEGLVEEVLINEERQPDLGGPGLHPTAGAVAIGARKLLVAFNINLHSTDLAIAKNIARQIRESGGGFPAVKALGLALPTRGIVQVSVNLTDYAQTSLFTVFDTVSRLAGAQGVTILESELIGLMPRKALEEAASGFLKLPNFSEDRIVESRLAKALRHSLEGE
jgi:glutamate formiminotransferase